MALITRIGRLFRADFNAVLDRIEEPDVLLKQALLEMEDDLNRDKMKLKSLEKEQSQIEQKINQSQKSIQQVNEELDICFDSNETELARNQIKRKLEMQRYDKHLNNRLNAITEQMNELKIRVSENENRFTTMQQKLELFVNEESNIKNNDFSTNLNASIDDDEIEIAFLREKQARSAS